MVWSATSRKVLGVYSSGTTWSQTCALTVKYRGVLGLFLQTVQVPPINPCRFYGPGFTDSGDINGNNNILIL